MPMAVSTAKRTEGRPTLDGVVRDSLEIKPAQEREEEQWQFIRDEVKKVKGECSKRTAKLKGRTRNN